MRYKKQGKCDGCKGPIPKGEPYRFLMTKELCEKCYYKISWELRRLRQKRKTLKRLNP